MPDADVGSVIGASASLRVCSTTLGFVLAATLLVIGWAAGPVEEEAQEVQRALLHVPGVSEDVRTQLWHLRQAGDPSAFFVGLLASILPTASDASAAADIALLGASPLALAFRAIEVWETWKGRSTAGHAETGAGRVSLRIWQVESANELLEKLSGDAAAASSGLKAPFWMMVRDATNRQDYCAVAEDVHTMWPQLRPGGFMVLHGGIRADTELRCANGSVVSGGVRAAAEDFMRGTPGVAGLELEGAWDPYGEYPWRNGQSLPEGLGRVVFPAAEAPYWLLRKAASGDEALRESKETSAIPIFAAPSAFATMSEHFTDDLDARVFDSMSRHLFSDTEQYWEYLKGNLPELTINEIYKRVVRLMNVARSSVSRPKIPRLMHQIYGFKCTNWDTGLWEPTCVDEATFDIPLQQLEDCFRDVLPFSRTQNTTTEAEVEWSWTVMQQVFHVCCNDSAQTNTRQQQAPLSVYSASRGVTLNLTIECSVVTPSCCTEARHVQQRRNNEPGKMRDDFLRWSLSWRRQHPDWKYVMWGPMEVKRLAEFHYPHLMYVMNGYPSWIYRADAAQWLILHHFGGIYASMDVEALRPIDLSMVGHALPKNPKRVAWSFVHAAEGASYDGGVSALLNEDGKINNFMSEGDDGNPVRRLDIHVVGSVAGHPLMREMLLQLVEHQYEFVLTATGNERFTAEVYEKGFINAVGLRILAREAYNPLDWSNTEMRKRCFQEDCADLFPGCYGIHHHANSWFGLRSEEVAGTETWTMSTSPLRYAGSENTHCWFEGITPELCCDVLKYGSKGNLACWTDVYTFETCCL